MKTTTETDLYLRLSDGRIEEALDGREAKLRSEAERLGWTVRRVVIENDILPDGRLRPASAFKRKKITTPSGHTKLRTVRPGFRAVLDDITSGRVGAMLAEDLDRACRDPRDLEDLIDACAAYKASARSLSGSLTLTNGGTDSEITVARIMVSVKNAESRDKARRVADKRETLAGQSYGGGKRPFGFRADPDTEKYHRNLVIVEDEAELLREAVRSVFAGISTKALARDFRDKGVPTVTGVAWTAQTLRDVLLKPAIAGLTVYQGEGLRPAPWPAIIERDEWERLKDILTDPSRQTNFSRSNEPRWLVSVFGRCGICNDGTGVHVIGGKDHKPSYTCNERGHFRRNAAMVDEYIGDLVIARLSEPDAADLLKPPRAAGIDAGKLRAEARKLRERKAAQMRMHSLGSLDDEDLAAGMKVIKARLAEIDAALATSDTPDPLAEFRDRPAAAVWESLPMARKRAVVKLLMNVTFLPSARRGPGFDPTSIDIERKRSA